MTQQHVLQWFSDVRSTLMKKEIMYVMSDPSRVFNFDETGFQMGEKSSKVLAKVGTKHVYEVSFMYIAK